TLRRSIGVMDIDANPDNTDFDTSQTHFVGHSGGAILGGVALATCGDCASISLISGGAGLIKLLEDSDIEDGFGFILDNLKKGLAQQGIVPDSSTYNNYLRDFQHVWNEGDAIGYVHLARLSATPVFGSLVNTDIVVTPSASLRLFEGIGLTQVKTPGDNFESKGYTRITEGDHGSYISPASSVAATVEMQTEAAVFLGGNALAGLPPNGQVILISNPAVVETE
ncbi:MAG: hypothetical protein PVJ48_08845, partial [Gammaproteobacteria bacterium]